MKRFIPAICCFAVTALVPAAANAQTWSYISPRFETRAPPPTEPSVPIAVHAAPAQPVVAPPKPVVRQRVVARQEEPVVVKRPAMKATGPVKMPSPEMIVMMVRSVLTSVNQANFTGNYSVLRGMTSPALQTSASAAKLGTAFADLRKQNVDLSPALVLQPQFTATPALTPQGGLRLTGFVPTRPLQIKFDIGYVPIDGYWMIDAISVSTLQGSPAPQQVASNPAPQPAAPQQAAPITAPQHAAAQPVAPPAARRPAEQPVAQQPPAQPPPQQQAAAVPRPGIPVPQILSPRPQQTSAQAKWGFWEPRFTSTTQFGPRLKFAELPR